MGSASRAWKGFWTVPRAGSRPHRAVLWLLKLSWVGHAFIVFGSLATLVYVRANGIRLTTAGIDAHVVRVILALGGAALLLVVCIVAHEQWLRRRAQGAYTAWGAVWLAATQFSWIVGSPGPVRVDMGGAGPFDLSRGVVAFEGVRLDLPHVLLAWMAAMAVALVIAGGPDAREETAAVGVSSSEGPSPRAP